MKSKQEEAEIASFIIGFVLGMIFMIIVSIL